MEFDDVGSSDLRELWESYLAETAMGHDVSIITRDEDNWGSGTSSCTSRDKTTPYCVVLRDRLMTDAALGGPRPIKSEHSYSLLASSPPASPAAIPDHDSPANIPIQNSLSEGKTCSSSTTTSLLNGQQVLVLRNRIDDMEEECFPAISLNRASGRGASAESPSQSPTPSLPLSSRSNSPITMTTNTDTCITLGPNATMIKTVNIKEEPFSPEPSDSYTPSSKRQSGENVETVAIPPYQLHFHGRPAALYSTSDSEDDEMEYYQSMELEESSGEPSASNSSSVAIAIGNGINGNGTGGGRQGLPPTPPSSASSDSEGAASASCSPERRVSDSLRGLLTPRFCTVTGNRGTHIHGHVTRQPIHTPLISCQPKGSTGILTLTDEEKRTLIAEGYPVPTKLPLTKQEEKSLKKVRRKIKNKISAQESRRKKKEYMDGLERRVTILAQENSSYKDRLTSLEGTNRELMRELQRLQTMLRSS